MLKPGQRLLCTVEGLGFQGEGVCKPDGFAVFVPFALPGETIHIEIGKVRPSHAFGRLLSVQTPAAERVSPPCGVFEKCGGCAAQHLPYAMQLDFKRMAVQTSLDRTARAGLQVNAAIGMDEPWRYRNKTTWQIAMLDGKIEIGFFGTQSRNLVPVRDCLIAKPNFCDAAQSVISWLRDEEHDGAAKPLPRQLVTQSNAAGETLVSLVVDEPDIKRFLALAEKLSKEVPGFAGLNLLTHEDGTATRVAGKDSLLHQLMGQRFTMSAGTFFQVNLEVCEKLYAYALKQANINPESTVFDIYSGAGTLSLLAAGHCKKVYGIELSEAAVRDANENARLNGIENTEFIQGLAEVELPKLVLQGIRAGAAILDPPRAGAQESVLRAIGKAGPERIVYISCNPATQARDAAILMNMGYRPIDAHPFDMFCQTAEIENVMTFVRSTP